MVDVKRGIYSGKPTECSIQGAPRPVAAPWADNPLVPPVSEGGFGRGRAAAHRRCGGAAVFLHRLGYAHLIFDSWYRQPRSVAAADAPGVSRGLRRLGSAWEQGLSGLWAGFNRYETLISAVQAS